MKKSFLALLFCLTVTAMFAQKSPAERAQKATRQMSKTLEMNDQQKTAVTAAYEEMYTGMAELRKSDQVDQTEKRNEIRSKFDTAITEALTPEQKAKWNGGSRQEPSKTTGNKKRQVKQAKVTPANRIESGANRTADRLATQVGLSDAQRTQVYDAYKAKQFEIEALRTKQTKRNVMLAAKKRINQEYQRKIDNILTAEQKVKREEFRSKRIQNHKANRGKEPGKKMEIHDKKGNPEEEAGNNRMEQQAAAYTDRMAKKLNLTEDQIQPFHQAFLKRISSLKGVKRMKGSIDQTDKKGVMDEYQASIERILTEEQIQKLDVLKKSKQTKKREE